MERLTLLVGLSHPDDELGAAGAILAQRARGDRVVVVWLTRGEQTEAYGPISTDEVAERRQVLGRQAGEILDAETLFLDLPDTAVGEDRETQLRLARLISEVRPDGLLTWGDAWVRGARHPDHQATGRLFRNAVTLARLAKLVSPLSPHRKPVPVFTLRDVHSTLPPAAVDVTAHRDQIGRLAALYRQSIGFGEPEWLERRLRVVGDRWGVAYAEEFDSWEANQESRSSLLPATMLEGAAHPDRGDPSRWGSG